MAKIETAKALTAYRVQEAELERARRAVAEAQAQLDYTRISAPISPPTIEARNPTPNARAACPCLASA